MEKVNARLAMVVVLLLLGVLLVGHSADAAEASAPEPQLGSSKGDCEISGTCDMKTIDPTRPGAVANSYTRGCSKINQCRD
ncbi:unnamed protein product [Urochloa decumbens]|uniref:Uncharacterized protein n=1 Tax=Urochloa decumbens TaxID=240449 RepID=A0ABC8ZAC3_9POAL